MNQANFFVGYEVITMIIVLVITKEKSLGTYLAPDWLRFSKKSREISSYKNYRN